MLPLKIHPEKNIAVVQNLKGAKSLIPHAQSVMRNGNEYLLVPAKKEELQLLRNLGFDAPSPLGVDYDWAGNVPFKAQVHTTDMLVHSPRGYVLNDMGTGKTLSALFAYDYLKKHGLVNKMLVLAPLSTLNVVWEREVFSRMHHLKCVSLWHRTSAGRRKILDANQDADIFVINHNGVAVIIEELLAMTDIDVVVVDELAVFRNKQTDLWKYANKVCANRKYVWGMTGSPTPKEPPDAWAQCKLITPSTVPKYYKQFREGTMVQLSQFRWIPKHEANDVVFSVMQPAVRFTRDDCVDLPDTTYSSREVALSPTQDKAYKAMVKQHYIEFMEGSVTAVNEGVKMGKLLQIACGFAYTEDRTVVDLKPSSRLTELEAIVDGTEHKVIVFVSFIEGVDRVHAHMVKQGYEVRKVYGDTPAPERNVIFSDFMHKPSLKLLVAHPQCMAHGLTLTEAATIVWFTPHQSLEIYEQANARITRPGQKNHTHIIHMESTPVERKVYKRLQTRSQVQGCLLEMFEEQKRGNL